MLSNFRLNIPCENRNAVLPDDPNDPDERETQFQEIILLVFPSIHPV